MKNHFYKGSVQPPEVFEKLQKQLAAAIRDGLPIAFGTYAGVSKNGKNAKEFAELAALGIQPPAAICTATIEAAKAVGLGGQIGTLIVGAFADIIAFEGNPLNELNALQKVKFIMKAGLPADRNTL